MQIIYYRKLWKCKYPYLNFNSLPLNLVYVVQKIKHTHNVQIYHTTYATVDYNDASSLHF